MYFLQMEISSLLSVIVMDGKLQFLTAESTPCFWTTSMAVNSAFFDFDPSCNIIHIGSLVAVYLKRANELWWVGHLDSANMIGTTVNFHLWHAARKAQALSITEWSEELVFTSNWRLKCCFIWSHIRHAAFLAEAAQVLNNGACSSRVWLSF